MRIGIHLYFKYRFYLRENMILKALESIFVRELSLSDYTNKGLITNNRKRYSSNSELKKVLISMN